VLGGGFGLWLGDNIAILPMVKQAHLHYSNKLWAHTILGQSNRWKIDWEDFLSYSCSCRQFLLQKRNPNPLVEAP
jgi:hypothetical protein